MNNDTRLSWLLVSRPGNTSLLVWKSASLSEMWIANYDSIFLLTKSIRSINMLGCHFFFRCKKVAPGLIVICKIFVLYQEEIMWTNSLIDFFWWDLFMKQDQSSFHRNAEHTLTDFITTQEIAQDQHVCIPFFFFFTISKKCDVVSVKNIFFCFFYYNYQ